MSDKESEPTFVQTNLKLLLEQSSLFPQIGKTGAGKDGPDDKKDDAELWCSVEAQAAFLGPNLWDKTLPYDADLKYVDLDEFLSENGIPVEGAAQQGGGGGGGAQHHVLKQASPVSEARLALGAVPPPPPPPPHSDQAPLVDLVAKRERSPSPSDTLSPSDTFNPPSPADSNEELKPQPMIKKSRKQFVPDDMKDDKYWARRRKNNMAAKRSRDARRIKENQIALRAGFLEKENMGLRQEMDRLKKENLLLRDKLSKFTDV